MTEPETTQQERASRKHRRYTQAIEAACVTAVELELVLGDGVERGRNRGRAQLPTDEAHFDLAASNRRRSDTAQDQRGLRASIIRADHHARRYADDPEVALAVRNFLECPPARAVQRDANLDQQLARLDRGLEGIVEEICCRNDALAGHVANHEPRVERNHHGWQLGGWIGVREAPTDRAARACRRMADFAQCLSKQ